MIGTIRRGAWLLPCAFLLLGCGGSTIPKADMDRARQALETCLEAWKKGEPVESLMKRPEPIMFTEEMPKTGFKLISYEILHSKNTDSETIRFTVKLNLQDRRGKTEERTPTYGVGLKNPIAVGRDPFS